MLSFEDTTLLIFLIWFIGRGGQRALRRKNGKIFLLLMFTIPPAAILWAVVENFLPKALTTR